MTLKEIEERIKEFNDQIEFWEIERKTIFNARYHGSYTLNLLSTMDKITEKINILNEEVKRLENLESEIKFCEE